MTLWDKQSSIKRRHLILLILLSIVFLCLLVRMLQLMVFERGFLVKQGNMRAIHTLAIPAYRGMITDRNGEPLAISTPVDAICANPSVINLADSKLKKISQLLQLNYAKLLADIKRNQKKEFLYLKRAVNPNLSDRIRELAVPGIFLQKEYKRFYPTAEVFSHVIGFTNIDDQGQEGLELAYNQWLQGKPGLKRVVQDRLGHIIAEVNIVKAPKPGHQLVLSLDKRMQYLAYRSLKQAVEKYKAVSGSVVVLDVHSGEVLAMVNQPAYNPNLRPKDTHGRYRNRAVTDTFEPGSTMKAFSVANALISGKYQPGSIVDTDPGRLRVQGHWVRDDRNNGKIDLTTILQRSSNVGVTKLTLSLPAASLPQLLHRLGFGRRTQSGFPGESSGYLPQPQVWRPFELATLSWGYGISITDLQLAQAYATIADGGIKHAVTFLKATHPQAGQRIFSAKIAHELLIMLESVVSKGGTATRAQIPGYRVSGKTGTTRLVGPHGYLPGHHNGIFVGIAPVSHPRFVVAVIIHDPRGQFYYGGLVAAPVFAKVMGGCLRMRNIAPDNLPAAKKIPE